MNERKKGWVRAFHPARGFGFVQDLETGEEVFCHYSQILSKDKFKILEDGELVTYEIGNHDGKPVAVRVIRTGKKHELLENISKEGV